MKKCRNVKLAEHKTPSWSRRDRDRSGGSSPCKDCGYLGTRLVGLLRQCRSGISGPSGRWLRPRAMGPAALYRCSVSTCAGHQHTFFKVIQRSRLCTRVDASGQGKLLSFILSRHATQALVRQQDLGGMGHPDNLARAAWGVC